MDWLTLATYAIAAIVVIIMVAVIIWAYVVVTALRIHRRAFKAIQDDWSKPLVPTRPYSHPRPNLRIVRD